MRGLYLECTAGAAGDMILAALHDCGLEMKEFKKQLQLLPVKGYVLQANVQIKKA